MAEKENKELVLAMWSKLYEKKFDEAAAYMADDGLYEDVPAPDAGAIGPANVARRLRIGLEPVERFEHDLHRIVADGDSVVLEHTETWHFHTGESLKNHFVTVHEVRDGKVTLWRDYWDLNTMMEQAPKWWLEHIMAHQGEEFA